MLQRDVRFAFEGSGELHHLQRSIASSIVCKLQKTADRRQQTADSRHQAAGSRQKTADGGQQAADSGSTVHALVRTPVTARPEHNTFAEFHCVALFFFLSSVRSAVFFMNLVLVWSLNCAREFFVQGWKMSA